MNGKGVQGRSPASAPWHPDRSGKTPIRDTLEGGEAPIVFRQQTGGLAGPFGDRSVSHLAECDSICMKRRQSLLCNKSFYRGVTVFCKTRAQGVRRRRYRLSRPSGWLFNVTAHKRINRSLWLGTRLARQAFETSRGVRVLSRDHLGVVGVGWVSRLKPKSPQSIAIHTSPRIGRRIAPCAPGSRRAAAPELIKLFTSWNLIIRYSFIE